MAETEDQKELEGKNVAHYSVMLAAYINARVDANKAIFVFSSTGIGLLIATVNKLQTLETCTKAIYIGALVSFFIAVCSTLFVHIMNANAIESYIRSEGQEKSMDFKLSTWNSTLANQAASGRPLSKRSRTP